MLGIAKAKRKGSTKGMASKQPRNRAIKRYRTTETLFKHWNNMEAATASINQSNDSQKPVRKSAANLITRFRYDGTEVSLGPVKEILHQQTHQQTPT